MTDTSGPLTARASAGGVDAAGPVGSASPVAPENGAPSAAPAAVPGRRSPAPGILSLSAAAAMVVGTWSTAAVGRDALLLLGIAVNLLSLIAIVLGIAAVALRRGRRAGLVGLALGALLNPALLAAVLPVIGGR